MAVSGIKEQRIDEEDYTTENMAVWLFLNTDEGKNSEVIFYAFPHDIDTSTIVLPWNSSIIKTTKLQEWVRMNDLSGHKNLLFFFNAISWDLEIFTFSETWAKNEVLDERIEIRFSYMDATSSSLQRKIIYFRNTNIVDYE
jgi:hypothetical protein